MRLCAVKRRATFCCRKPAVRVVGDSAALNPEYAVIPGSGAAKGKNPKRKNTQRDVLSFWKGWLKSIFFND